MNTKTYNYIKFDEKELQTFLDIMDVEKTGLISFGDIESTCKMLGLSDSYSSIKNVLKDMVDTNSGGGISADELRKQLCKSKRTQEEEMAEIFNYIDYDRKGEINKNKLKIIIQELTEENISDKEAEEMIKLLQNKKGVVDLESFLKLNHMKVDL
jgi:Ca2+-binding EF-hand superfamily protein